MPGIPRQAPRLLWCVSRVPRAKGKAWLAAWELPGGCQSLAGHFPHHCRLLQCLSCLSSHPALGLAGCVLLPVRWLGSGGMSVLVSHRVGSREDGSCTEQYVGSDAPRESLVSCAAAAKGVSRGGGTAYQGVSPAGCVTLCSSRDGDGSASPGVAMPDPGSTQVRAGVEMFALEQFWTCLGAG